MTAPPVPCLHYHFIRSLLLYKCRLSDTEWSTRKMKEISSRQELLREVAGQPLVIVICHVRLDPSYDQLVVNHPKVKFLKVSKT